MHVHVQLCMFVFRVNWLNKRVVGSYNVDAHEKKISTRKCCTREFGANVYVEEETKGTQDPTREPRRLLLISYIDTYIYAYTHTYSRIYTTHGQIHAHTHRYTTIHKHTQINIHIHK